MRSMSMWFQGRVSSLAVLVITSFCLFPAIHAIKTIEDLFDVSYDRTVGGHCADYGSTRLNAMLGDANDMAKAGIRMVAAANSASDTYHAQAVRMLDAWFESPFLTATQYDRAGVFYQSVSDWLNGRLRTVDGGRSSLKPLLVCDNNGFVLRQAMTDQAWGFNQNGNQVRLTHNDGRPFLIQDNAQYVNSQAGTSAVIRQQTYPYWSARLGQYVWDKIYGTQQLPTDWLCAGPGNNRVGPLGVTKSWSPRPNMVLLCASAFRNTGVRTASVALTCLDATQLVNRVPPNNNAAGITTSINIIADGSTLFHEMIHLIQGVSATVPVGNEEYSPRTMLGGRVRPSTGQLMTSDMAFVNPETYTYAATGFDYTLRAPLVNNRPPEFYTGYCTWQT